MSVKWSFITKEKKKLDFSVRHGKKKRKRQLKKNAKRDYKKLGSPFSTFVPWKKNTKLSRRKRKLWTRNKQTAESQWWGEKGKKQNKKSFSTSVLTVTWSESFLINKKLLRPSFDYKKLKVFSVVILMRNRNFDWLVHSREKTNTVVSAKTKASNVTL